MHKACAEHLIRHFFYFLLSRFLWAGVGWREGSVTHFHFERPVEFDAFRVAGYGAIYAAYMGLFERSGFHY